MPRIPRANEEFAGGGDRNPGGLILYGAMTRVADEMGAIAREESRRSDQARAIFMQNQAAMVTSQFDTRINEKLNQLDVDISAPEDFKYLAKMHIQDTLDASRQTIDRVKDPQIRQFIQTDLVARINAANAAMEGAYRRKLSTRMVGDAYRTLSDLQQTAETSNMFANTAQGFAVLENLAAAGIIQPADLIRREEEWEVGLHTSAFLKEAARNPNTIVALGAPAIIERYPAINPTLATNTIEDIVDRQYREKQRRIADWERASHDRLSRIMMDVQDNKIAPQQARDMIRGMADRGQVPFRIASDYSGTLMNYERQGSELTTQRAMNEVAPTAFRQAYANHTTPEQEVDKMGLPPYQRYLVLDAINRMKSNEPYIRDFRAQLVGNSLADPQTKKGGVEAVISFYVNERIKSKEITDAQGALVKGSLLKDLNVAEAGIMSQPPESLWDKNSVQIAETFFGLRIPVDRIGAAAWDEALKAKIDEAVGRIKPSRDWETMADVIANKMLGPATTDSADQRGPYAPNNIYDMIKDNLKPIMVYGNFGADSTVNSNIPNPPQDYSTFINSNPNIESPQDYMNRRRAELGIPVEENIVEVFNIGREATEQRLRTPTPQPKQEAAPRPRRRRAEAPSQPGQIEVLYIGNNGNE